METLNLQLVQSLLNEGVAIAKSRFRRPACIAVCDSHGFLAGFYRMDGAPERSIRISQQKAYTSARMGVSTTAFLARLQRDKTEIGYFCDPLFTAMPGGAPLFDEQGHLIGCVGISGFAPDEDQALADELASLSLSGKS